MPNKKQFDIYNRVFDFAVKTVKFLDKLPKSTASFEYSKQLTRSSGSIGANLEEADGALSRKDFVYKLGIARKEAKESKHWLRLIESTSSIKGQDLKEEMSWLIQENTEIMLILNSIITKTKENN